MEDYITVVALMCIFKEQNCHFDQGRLFAFSRKIVQSSEALASCRVLFDSHSQMLINLCFEVTRCTMYEQLM